MPQTSCSPTQYSDSPRTMPLPHSTSALVCDKFASSGFARTAPTSTKALNRVPAPPFAYQFQPYAGVSNDMFSSYSGRTRTIINNSTFPDPSSLKRGSCTANYLLLLDFILAAISVFSSGRSRSNRSSALGHSPSRAEQDTAVWTTRVKNVRWCGACMT